MEDVRVGWLKPEGIEQKVTRSFGRYLRGNPDYFKHTLTVDGEYILEYFKDSKITMTREQVQEVLAGSENTVASDLPEWHDITERIEAWAVRAFDYRNFQMFGMTVGSMVVTKDKSYFGGAWMVGEVAEVDPDDDNLPICVKFDGFPYLYFNFDELEVRSQPVKVPMALALPQERDN